MLWWGQRVPPPLPRSIKSFAALLGVRPDIMGAIGNSPGLPAIAVPNGFSDKGLPTGVQFMGRAYDENVILAVARTYQSLTAWHLRHPPDLTP